MLRPGRVLTCGFTSFLCNPLPLERNQSPAVFRSAIRSHGWMSEARPWKKKTTYNPKKLNQWTDKDLTTASYRVWGSKSSHFARVSDLCVDKHLRLWKKSEQLGGGRRSDSWLRKRQVVSHSGHQTSSPVWSLSALSAPNCSCKTPTPFIFNVQ